MPPTSCVGTRIRLLPSGAIVKIHDQPSGLPRYAMRVPSGDQRGIESAHSLFVSCTTLLPSAFITNILLALPVVANRIFVPSGDQLGEVSRTVFVVTRATLDPSEFMTKIS